MSTVTEIKAAIDQLSPAEKAELEVMLWSDEETPPNAREKVQQALDGKFTRGDRRSIDKIISSIE